MSSLDPRSLIVMGNFMALVMGVVLGFMWRHYPRNIRGLSQWALMPVVWVVGAFVFVVPVAGGLSLLLANAGVLAGFGLFHLGCRHFLGQPCTERPLLIAYALLLVATGWFIWVTPSYAGRVVLVTSAIAALHTGTLVLL